jgi:hypothetical protein
MKIQDILTETGDSPYRIPNFGKYKQTTVQLPDGRRMGINFEPLILESGATGYLYSFDVDGELHISGGGDAIRIYSTATAVFNKFVQEMVPDFVVFIGTRQEPSRIKFYDRWANRLSNRLYSNITELEFKSQAYEELFWEIREAVDELQDISDSKLYVIANRWFLKDLTEGPDYTNQP